MRLFDFLTGGSPRVSFEVEPESEKIRELRKDPVRMEYAMAQLSNEGKLFEAQYGPITDAEYHEAINNKTPAEVQWEARAAANFYPKLAGGVFAGGLFGYLFVRGQRRLLVNTRRRVLEKEGKKGLKDPTVATSDWVESVRKTRIWTAQMAGLCGLLGGSLALQRYYPDYITEVASMPNSRMALAVKRMHRQHEMRDELPLRAVDPQSVQLAGSDFASKDAMIGSKVPPELAAGQVMAAGLTGGGYKG
ncbi:hypothetical protein DIPPA_21227 [Diplonema papillatum]|nr:hypothetical protein DIPPA_21227 [Diplonema papillatum]